jgi:OFA family oxalate/formate antiporter-like MFS transporter
MYDPQPMNRWRVVAGGVLMNLALGSLYAWSVFVAPLEKEFGWRRAQTSLVFTIAVVTFAITFIFGGRLQDRRGPRPAAFIGTVLVSLGFFLTSLTSSLTFLYVVFGVIVGAGNGFGYATPIPVASKWFPDKRGLVVGLMVGGYGASSAIIGPLATNPHRIDRLAYHVPDPRPRVSRDGHGRNVPDGEPTGRLQARRLDAVGFRRGAA